MINKYKNDSSGSRIAYFISSHGFGHAARASAVMETIQNIDSSIHFDIFTQVPSWFFEDSLSGSFRYHEYQTDIGIVQTTPLVANLPATIKCLNGFLPFELSLVNKLSNLIIELQCRMIICDISPLGIAVAEVADIPSVLVENFTWDWIYSGYTNNNSDFDKHITYLRNVVKSANYHIQTEPVCKYFMGANLVTQPISRKPRASKKAIRALLGIPDKNPAILVTMGGISEKYMFINQLSSQKGINFILPGSSSALSVYDNLALLPHHSDFFHPDLINACDAVIGKVGYSTIAEIYHAGVPFGYIARPRFRESQYLSAFIEREMNGFEVREKNFKDGSWVAFLHHLLRLPRIYREVTNGADQIASYLSDLLK